MKDMNEFMRRVEDRISVYKQDIKNREDIVRDADIDIANREGIIEGIELMIEWIGLVEGGLVEEVK